MSPSQDIGRRTRAKKALRRSAGSDPGKSASLAALQKNNKDHDERNKSDDYYEKREHVACGSLLKVAPTPHPEVAQSMDLQQKMDES